MYANSGRLSLVGFDLESVPNPHLTHLIYNGNKRTIKLLYALAKSNGLYMILY